MENNGNNKGPFNEMDKIVKDFGIPVNNEEPEITLTDRERKYGFSDYQRALTFTKQWINAIKSQSIDPDYAYAFFEGYMSTFMSILVTDTQTVTQVISTMEKTIKKAK